MAVDDEFPFPVVSFQPILTGGEEEKAKVALQLYDAFHTYGWVYLKEFGISAEEIDEMFGYSKRFFDRPEEEKLKDKVVSAAYCQGYTANGAESSDTKGGRSHKECYEHRRFNNDLCPAAGGEDGFREFADSFYQKCFTLATEVLRALCIVLGIAPTYWDDKLAAADPQLRFLRYMSIPKTTLEKEGNYRIEPHTDYGLCTLLFQDEVGGLEVDRFHDGKFAPATPLRGTCIINVADLLQRLSNDKLRSTRHRVMMPLMEPRADGMLPARYSTAFFVHPDPATMIVPIVKEGETTPYEPVNAGEWRTMITSRDYGYALPDSKDMDVKIVAASKGEDYMNVRLEAKSGAVSKTAEVAT
ncbi:Clavaminate synthase-like protein [Mytilinidion resinicola]|uniref:Clavaminate synthase-like protein n=1 Tax=Mytilinidion resinicola TaxID=574789 RepID=A0A6A6YWR1_9PEZI|nr:Clavaminate synthase-like protein [Mytilinidion resinicola]KAF2812434.1 Clavaminate synthase-like protein [Mytilinidion resinicola]